ncbi:MAG: fibronectin type III domain-containing protein [bacterium]|nr:fibronectin type III domain-containing protein [bacterium]
MKKYLIVLALLFPLIASAQAFDHDLYFGVQGDVDVTKLQEFLTDQNFYSGPITGNFFSLTLSGVKKFQTSAGITPAAGYFGPLTRAKANAVLGVQINASNQQAVAETSSTPPTSVSATTTSSTNKALQAQLTLLLKQVMLLQQQLQAQSSTTQAAQTAQTQTLQQIQQNTQAIQQNTTPPIAVYVPPSLPPYIPPPPPAGSPADTIPPVISTVQAISVAANSATITWTTNENSDSTAYLGTTPGSYYTSANGSVSSAYSGYTHTVTFSSLSPNTTYFYKVTSADGSGNKSTSNEYTFSTLPPPAGTLTVSLNSSVGNQGFTINTSAAKIGSYAITASSAEGISVSSITIVSSARASTDYQNLMVKVGSAVFGSTYSALTNNTSYVFSGNSFTVSAGQTVVVDVYADILPGAVLGQQASTFTNCVATGLLSGASIGCNTPVNGQTVTIVLPLTLSIGLDGASASSGQLVMGSTGNSLASFRFTETSNNEDVRITDLVVFQRNNSGKTGFGNLTLYDGGTPVGSAGSGALSANGNGYNYAFHFASPVMVGKSGSKTLVLKGDAASYASGGAVDNSTSIFEIAPSTEYATASTLVTAFGASSNTAVANIFLSGPVGNKQTVLRSVLTVMANSAASPRPGKSTIDDVGTITFAASPAGSVSLNQVVLTFSGTMPSSTFINNTANMKLYDPSTGTPVPGSVSASSYAFTYTIGSGIGGYVISAGSSKTFTIRIDSNTNSNDGRPGVSQTFGVTLANTTAVTYVDALDGAGNSINLPATLVPMVAANVSYPAGT